MIGRIYRMKDYIVPDIPSVKKDKLHLCIWTIMCRRQNITVYSDVRFFQIYGDKVFAYFVPENCGYSFLEIFGSWKI